VNSDSRLGHPSWPPQIVQHCSLSRLVQEFLWHSPHGASGRHTSALIACGRSSRQARARFSIHKSITAPAVCSPRRAG